MKTGVFWVLAAMFLTSGGEPLNAENPAKKQIIRDPYDYNFCGGERVYPRVGVNFSTACGPRNQIAMGRRGKMLWFFPSPDGIRKSYRGVIKLNKEQLARLTMMAEVAMLAEVRPLTPDRVLYTMGINFSARRIKSLRAPLTDRYTPANALLRMMLEIVPPDQRPALPECGAKNVIFDPTQHRADRLKTLGKTTRKKPTENK